MQGGPRGVLCQHGVPREGGQFNRFPLLFIRLKACLGGMFSGRKEKCAQKK